MDVTDEASVASAIDAADDLDAVICNAGVGWFAPLEVMSGTSFERTIDTNLIGAVRVIRHALPRLRASGDGRVVVISSLAAIAGLPGESAYCASKAGLEAAMESLRHEVEPLGVRVSVIQPGYTADTGLVVSGRAPGAPDDSVYEALFVHNESSHAAVRAGAESPALVCEALRDALEAPEPRFRYPLGSLAPVAHALRSATDDEVHTAIGEMFGVADWAPEIPA